MITCTTCGWENPDGVGACEGCGAALPGGRVAPDGRPQPGPVSDTAPPTGGARPGPPAHPAAPLHPYPAAPPHPYPYPAAPPPHGPTASSPPVPARPPPSVPRRSIPVRVAPTPIRQVVRETPLRPDHVSLPGPAEQVCPRCGRRLPAERRFCACGADLARRRLTDEPVRVTGAGPWWSEWVANRRFRRAQRAVGAGPVGYDARTSPRTWLVRFVLILLVLLALATQVGPWGGALRRDVAGRVERVVAEGAGAGRSTW